MFTVYIIEDNIQFAKKISEVIGQYSDTYKDFSVSNCHVLTNNFERFSSSLVHFSSKKYIYILDIDLGTTLTGLDIARKIRQFDFDGYIIFLTAHEEYTKQVLSYNLKAINYINKSSSSFIGELNKTFSSILNESPLSEAQYQNKFVYNNNYSNLTFHIRDSI